MPSTGPPPTIIINSSRPAPPTGSQPPPQQQQGPKSSQAVPTAATISKSCYLCDEQNPGDFSPTTKFLDTCLLCSRDFCPIHKSSHWDQVCNINHSTYYHECLENAREKLAADGQASADKRELAEMLIDEGIFPSLGEREKAIFATGPVTKLRELESFRSLDAQLAGTAGAKKTSLIEERDIVGADIAV